MIARIWRGWATRANADAYEAHFRESVLPHLEALPGFRDAHLLRRDDGDDEVELVAQTYFESMDAVRAFAGTDPNRAVVEPSARAVLSRFDEHVTHHTVIVSATP